MGSQACIDAAATPVNIAGYEPASDVIQHARIDLDVNAIIDDLPGKNSADINDCVNNQCKYDADNMAAPVTAGKASDVWTNGKYSRKSSSLRTIKGFAEGAADKSSCSGGKTPCIKVATDVDYKDNGFIRVMNAYWKKKGLDEFTWGEQIIDAAFKGTPLGEVDFSTVGWDFRKETIGKGIVYLNVFPYVIWEMQDAINDCKAGKLSANADSVHAWDEAVAFYTGSLEGTTEGGDVGLTGGYGEGELQFTLAEKRCKNFGTCTADFDMNPHDGYSEVNKKIFALFSAGRDEILSAVDSTRSDKCEPIAETMNEISGLMLVPFIQGVQRYLYKTAQGTASAKEAGELFAFASAALPFIDAVDSTAADKLYNRAWKQDFTTESDFKTIKYAVEGTYSQLGVGTGQGKVTCSAVGELNDSGNVLSEACVDPKPSSQTKKEKDKELALGLSLGLGLGLGLLLIFAVFVAYTRNQKLKKFEILLKERGVEKV